MPVGFSFTGVTVRVTDRTAYVPEAAFYNDGAVDVTKEFQPFGAVAKRGDAFYVRSDEAFGKALATVEVAVQVMQEGGAPLSSSAGGTGIPVWLADTLKTQLLSIKNTLGSQYASVETQWTSIYGAVSTTTTPSVVWQRREDGAWKQVGTASSSFGTLSAPVTGSAVASETFAVAGQAGPLPPGLPRAGRLRLDRLPGQGRRLRDAGRRRHGSQADHAARTGACRSPRP